VDPLDCGTRRTPDWRFTDRPEGFEVTAQIIGSMLAAGAVPVIAYRAGRAHAAWRDARSAKRALRRDRRTAWAHTLRLAVGAVLLLLGLAAAAFDLAH
jgi:cytochrome c biogenesis protein CcdA